MTVANQYRAKRMEGLKPTSEAHQPVRSAFLGQE
jgi:hypothetical protein